MCFQPKSSPTASNRYTFGDVLLCRMFERVFLKSLQHEPEQICMPFLSQTVLISTKYGN